jgi:uncharacterized protein YjiS (DUF1127 family)
MLIKKILYPLFHLIYNCFVDWRAVQRKKRSERALAKLDDHLLDDIGMCRVDDEIVPIKRVVSIKSANSRRERLLARKRLRHPFLLRRREE